MENECLTSRHLQGFQWRMNVSHPDIYRGFNGEWMSHIQTSANRSRDPATGHSAIQCSHLTSAIAYINVEWKLHAVFFLLCVIPGTPPAKCKAFPRTFVLGSFFCFSGSKWRRGNTRVFLRAGVSRKGLIEFVLWLKAFRRFHSVMQMSCPLGSAALFGGPSHRTCSDWQTSKLLRFRPREGAAAAEHTLNRGSPCGP